MRQHTTETREHVPHATRKRRCGKPHWHTPHTVRVLWHAYECPGGVNPDHTCTADCDKPEPCGCADPGCPCDYKPGWGPYAAPGRPADLGKPHQDDY